MRGRNSVRASHRDHPSSTMGTYAWFIQSIILGTTAMSIRPKWWRDSVELDAEQLLPRRITISPSQRIHPVQRVSKVRGFKIK